LVYRVWTEPDQMSHWLVSNGVTTPQDGISQDLQVGGYWRWTMVDEQDGARYAAVAQFLEIVEPEKLVFTWGGEDAQPALITLTFAEHSGGTRLTLHLAGPAEMVTDESGIEEGWYECLDVLGRFLTGRVLRR
jgi:uncharacterized protein YndB with AHSA1/START domain